MSTEFINSRLYDLNVELDILEHWRLNYPNDHLLEEKVKHLIITNVVSLYIAKPDINNIEGVPLNALHRLMLIKREFDLNSGKFDHIFQSAIDYLSFIENDVNEAWSRRREIQNNPFKRKSGDTKPKNRGNPVTLEIRGHNESSG